MHKKEENIWTDQTFVKVLIENMFLPKEDNRKCMS